MAALSGIAEILASHLGQVAGLVVFAITGAVWSSVFTRPDCRRTHTAG